MENSSLMLENMLDTCITAIQEQGRTVDECLASYAAGQREELEPLLRLAARLKTTNTVKAPPEFRRAAVARMANWTDSRPQKAADLKSPRSSSGQSRHAGTTEWVKKQAAGKTKGPEILEALQVFLYRMRQKMVLAALASLLLIVLLDTGSNVVSAANRAYPGERLYPLKSTLESVQLALSLKERGDARLHITFARRRLIEAAFLLEKDRPESVDESLMDYSVQVKTVTAFLAANSSLSPAEQESLAALLIKDLSPLETQLNALSWRSPAEVQACIQAALANTENGLQAARRVLKTVSPEVETLPALPGMTPTATATPQPGSVPQAAATPVPLGTEWVEGEYHGLWTIHPTLVVPYWPGEWSDEEPADKPSWSGEAPKSWPWAVPTVWPGDSPEAWPTDLPGAWAPDAWPTDFPEDWPEEQDGHSEFKLPVPPDWPADFPEPEPPPASEGWTVPDPPPDDPDGAEPWPEPDPWPDEDRWPIFDGDGNG